MKQKFIRFILWLADGVDYKDSIRLSFFLLTCVSATAFTTNDVTKIAVSDGSYDDTSNAVYYAISKAEDGWRVKVGYTITSNDWSRTLVVNIPHVFILDFEGVTTFSYTGAFAMSFTASNLKTITVKDGVFPEYPNVSNALMRFLGSNDAYRLTNCRFYQDQKFAYWVGTPNGAPDGTGAEGPYGLVDNCWFVAPNSPVGGFYRANDTLTSWRSPHSWGTRKVNVIEDCVFSSGFFANGFAAIDGDSGCRILFRNNILTNSSFGVHGSEGDPATQPWRSYESAMQLEVAHNTFVMTDDYGAGQTIFLRGGTMRAWDNTFSRTDTGYYNVAFKMEYYRNTAHGLGFPLNPTAEDRTYIDGSGTGGDEYVGTGQPGSGYVGTTGADPNHPSEPWGSVPIRIWSNTFNVSPSFVLGYDTTFTQLDRDLFYSTDDSAAPEGFTELAYPHPLRAATGAGIFGSVKFSGKVRL